MLEKKKRLGDDCLVSDALVDTVQYIKLNNHLQPYRRSALRYRRNPPSISDHTRPGDSTYGQFVWLNFNLRLYPRQDPN